MWRKFICLVCAMSVRISVFYMCFLLRISTPLTNFKNWKQFTCESFFHKTACRFRILLVVEIKKAGTCVHWGVRRATDGLWEVHLSLSYYQPHQPEAGNTNWTLSGDWLFCFSILMSLICDSLICFHVALIKMRRKFHWELHIFSFFQEDPGVWWNPKKMTTTKQK